MALLEAKFTILVFCSLLMFANFHPSLVFDIKTVRIENGEIMGEDRGTYIAFKGIPYAEALRFALPRPYARKWENVEKFDKFGDQCAQYNHLSYTYVGSENCLNLNVYVPKKLIGKHKQLVPVVFFIHGGAFMFGAGDFYGADVMMQENVILVTINYRLGILGFLSTEDEVIPGNLGLKDQVEALRWVQRNIRAFNGDPDKVTITGFSAGGASVQLHFLSPLSQKLFASGISHSGVALNPWVMMERAREKAHEVSALMKCSKHTKTDSRKLRNCLKMIPAEQLVMAVKHFQPFLYNPFSPFGVVVEKKNNKDHPFINEHPRELLAKGKFQPRRYISSMTKDEGLYPASEFYTNETVKTIDENWEQLAPHLLDYNSTTSDEELKLEWSRTIRKFYFGDERITVKNFDKLTKLMTDRLFKSTFQEALTLQSSHAPTHCYHFNYRTKESATAILRNSSDFLGISHGDDVFLIYNNRKLDEYTSDEATIQRDFVEMYRALAQSDSAVYEHQEISPIEAGTFECMDISAPVGNKMTPIDNSFGEADFWHSLNIPE